MANINVKHLLRYDTWENWSTSNATTQNNKTHGDLVLLKGEVGICEIPSNNAQATTAPTVLIKVGNGKDAFKALPWASALAADVYDWAKKSENDFVKNFLSLKMTDGTTMFDKLDESFASDADLAGAIDDLRKEIPTQLGVMSIKVTDDDVVIGTPEAATGGDVTIDIKHAKKGPTGGAIKGATADVTVSGYSDTKTIKVPKVTVDEYGHTTGLTEQTLTITMPAQQDLSGYQPKGNYKTTQTAVTSKITEAAHVLTSLSQNANGVISYDVKELTPGDIGAQPAGNYKTVQTAVSSPSPLGSALAFIDEISQDTNGKITATKKNVDLSNYALKSEIPTIPNIKITNDTTAEVPTTDTVNVYKNLTASGHTLTEELVTVPTKAYVDKTVAGAVAGAVDYLGVVNSAADLANKALTATHGDFVRVATAFGNYHNGDLLIYNKPASGTATWDIIHGEEGDITEIVAGNGLTDGGSTGSVTLNVGAGDGITVAADKVSVKADKGLTFDEDEYLVAKIGDGLEFGSDDEIKVKSGNHITVDANGVHHGAKPTSGNQHAATAGSGRTYVTKVDVDDYGHIAKVYTASESVVDTNTWRKVQVNGTQLLGDAITTKPLNLVAGTDITLTPDATNGKVTINSNGITVSVNGQTTDYETINVLSHQITSNGHNLNVNYYEVATKAGLDAVKKSITDLDYADTAVAGQYVSEVDQVDGKIKVTRTALPSGTGSVQTVTKNSDGSVKINGGVKLSGHTLSDDTSKTDVTLHKISTTGSIYDVTEGSTTNAAGETYLVFYGGTSTEII